MQQPFVSKKSFYSGQKVVAQEVESYAKESMKNEQNNANEKIILSGDCRYPILRN